MTPDFDFKFDGLPPLHELAVFVVVCDPHPDGVWRVRINTWPHHDVPCNWRVVFESHDEETAQAARGAFRRLVTAAKLMVQP